MGSAPIFCAEKQKLIEDFEAAVSALFQLQSAKVAAVASGDRFQLETQLELARARKDSAKEAIVQHMRAHCC
jgi:hypothetical protein